jgi:hypothetical protein
MNWQKCPICKGHGIVPSGFYLYPEGQSFYSTSCSPEQCRTCLGTGKILEAPDWTPDKKEEQ